MVLDALTYIDHYKLVNYCLFICIEPQKRDKWVIYKTSDNPFDSDFHAIPFVISFEKKHLLFEVKLEQTLSCSTGLCSTSAPSRYL